MGFKYKPNLDEAKIMLLEPEKLKAYKILVHPIVMRKMEIYVDQCAGEVSWLGSVTRNGNDFIIDEVVLFKQTCSAATSDIEPNAQFDMVKELELTPRGKDIRKRLLFHGHSHVNMGISPSGTDNNQMMEFKAFTDYFIRAIMNKKGDIAFDIYLFKDNLHLVNVPWDFYYPEFVCDENAIKAEIKDKVKSPIYPMTTFKSENKWQHGAYGNFSNPQVGKFPTFYHDKAKTNSLNKKEAEEDYAAAWLSGVYNDD